MMEETIQQLQQQVAVLTAILTEQMRLTQNRVLQFNLTPDQIIKHFNNIPLFSGENSFKLKSFLKNVEQAEQLCNDNDELRSYCLAKIIDGNIIERARAIILRIPDAERNWQNVVGTLGEHFKPRNTIHKLLFQARGLKVFNLKDLFNKLSNVETEANEISDFNNDEPFSYQSIQHKIIHYKKTNCNLQIKILKFIVIYQFIITIKTQHSKNLQINHKVNNIRDSNTNSLIINIMVNLKAAIPINFILVINSLKIKIMVNLGKAL